MYNLHENSVLELLNKLYEIPYIRSMIRILKPWFSVFLLAIFLFPTIVKEVHTVNHEKRFHCDANGDQHLHTLHHDCNLCDFVIPVVSAPSSFQTHFFLTHFAEYSFPHQVEFYFSSSRFSSPSLRAPPVFA